MSGPSVFCDWRFNVFSCESSDFFYPVAVYMIAIESLQTFLCLFRFLFQVFVLKAKPRAFRFGDLGLNVVFLVTIAVYVLQAGLMLGGYPFASEVVWAFLMPFGFVPVVFYLATILEAFPEIFVSPKTATLMALVNSAKFRRALLTCQFLFMFVLNMVLYIAAWALEDERNPIVSFRLKQAALGSLALNILVLMSLFLYVSYFFRILLTTALANVKDSDSGGDTKERKSRIKSLEEVNVRIRGNMNAMVVESVLMFLYQILLAFYPDFFSNLPFSKAMAIIFCVIFPTVPIAQVLKYVILELRRHFNPESGSSHQESQSPHQSMTLKQKDSEIGKENTQETPLEKQAELMDSFLDQRS